jgi:hypothetical protein
MSEPSEKRILFWISKTMSVSLGEYHLLMRTGSNLSFSVRIMVSKMFRFTIRVKYSLDFAISNVSGKLVKATRRVVGFLAQESNDNMINKNKTRKMILILNIMLSFYKI